MPKFKIGGRSSVATLKKRFLQDFGVEIRVYGPDGYVAGNKVALNSIRSHPPVNSEFEIGSRSRVGSIQDRFKEWSGITVEIQGPNGQVADENITLATAARHHAEATLDNKVPEDAHEPKWVDPEMPARDADLACDIVCLGLHLESYCGDPNARVHDLQKLLTGWYKDLGMTYSEARGPAILDLNAGIEKYNWARAATGSNYFYDHCISHVRDTCSPAERKWVLDSIAKVFTEDRMVATGLMGYLCAMAAWWDVPLPAGIHEANTAIVGEDEPELARLVWDGVLFNLYDNVAIWGKDQSDFAAWDKLDTGGSYRHHLYGFWFGYMWNDLPPEQLVTFLNARLMKKWRAKVFGEEGATLGIYNAHTNQLMVVGLGDSYCLRMRTLGGNLKGDEWQKAFCELDHGGIVDEVLALLREVSELARQASDDAEPDEEYGVTIVETDEADGVLRRLRMAIPTIPASADDFKKL